MTVTTKKTKDSAGESTDGVLPRQRREPAMRTEAGDRVPTRWDAVTWAQELRIGDAKGKAVLWSLVSHGNAAHAVWISIPTIVMESELSKSSVLRGVGVLLEQALMVKIETFDDGTFRQDSQQSNLYVLNVDEWLNDLATGSALNERRVVARVRHLSTTKGENFLPSGRRFEA